MKRRDFITLLGGAAAVWPLAAQAQQAGKIYRVGLLSPIQVGPVDARRTTLLTALAARGFVDGQNLAVVQRSADGHLERLDGLAAELKAANVDVIVTFGYPAVLAAKKSTKDIPIIVTGAGDPVATGLVDGLARPGGNITGVTELSTELSAERLEILRDALPAMARVAMLWNAADLGMTLALPSRRGRCPRARGQSADLGRTRARRFRSRLRRDDARAPRRDPDGVRCPDHTQPQARFGICQHQPPADDLRDRRAGARCRMAPSRATSAKSPPVSWPASCAARGQRTYRSSCPRTSSSSSI
jgi:hypothetical protein